MLVPKSVDLTKSVTFKRSLNESEYTREEDIKRQKDDKYNVLIHNCGFPSEGKLRYVGGIAAISVVGGVSQAVYGVACGGFFDPYALSGAALVI